MARLLLDTHVLLWSLTDPRALSGRARDALQDPANDVFVSPVSGWEIAVKRALGNSARRTIWRRASENRASRPCFSRSSMRNRLAPCRRITGIRSTAC